MLHERYLLDSAGSAMSFEFVSEGPKGKILKIIQYRESHIKGVYYLGLGDKVDTSPLDDLIISDNGDSRKILATVAFSIYLFTATYPNAWVLAIGNTKSKTRLYRMGINTVWNEIKRDFDLYGLRKGKALPFQKNEDYDGFLIRRKKVNS